MKKIAKVISLILAIMVFTSTVFATQNQGGIVERREEKVDANSSNVKQEKSEMVNKDKTTMKLVEDNKGHIDFGKYGKFDKYMSNIDTEKKTIDITLKVSNNQDVKVEHEDGDIGEVVLLMDGSNSMKANKVDELGGKTRAEVVYDAATKLVDSLFERNPKIKVGVVEFATTTNPKEEGQGKDAKQITTGLETDKSKIKSAIDTIRTDKMGPRTNIQEGLQQADKLLDTSTEKKTKKAIVILTDAIPNTASGVSFDTYSDKSAVPTRQELERVKEKGTKVISMLINMKDEPIAISQEDPKPTYKKKAEQIFGTTTNPVAGPVYYVEDSGITKTVTEEILKDIAPERTIITSYTLTNIVIKDYFPENIVKNFDYLEMVKASKGTATSTIDKNDNSITWTIPELKPNEEATLTYKLKLKDNIEKSIIGINLPTNKKVTINYEENGKKQEPKETTKSPIVALDMVPDKPLPQTGSYTLYTVSIMIVLALAIGIGFKIKSKN